MVNLSQKPLMLSEIFLTSESINELGNFYGVVSVDMSPDAIWNTGSIWLVWRQMCQTDGVLLMNTTLKQKVTAPSPAPLSTAP